MYNIRSSFPITSNDLVPVQEGESPHSQLPEGLQSMFDDLIEGSDHTTDSDLLGITDTSALQPGLAETDVLGITGTLSDSDVLGITGTGQEADVPVKPTKRPSLTL
eukprot:Pgem_evm1s16795